MQNVDLTFSKIYDELKQAYNNQTIFNKHCRDKFHSFIKEYSSDIQKNKNTFKSKPQFCIPLLYKLSN